MKGRLSFLAATGKRLNAYLAVYFYAPRFTLAVKVDFM